MDQQIYVSLENVIPTLRGPVGIPINGGGSIGGNFTGKNPPIKKSKNEDKKCAPSKKLDKNTCFTLESLQEIANAFNTYVHMKLINKQPINITNDKTSLISQIDNRLHDICNDQLCWIEQDFLKVIDRDKRFDIEENTFRPEGPEGRFTWLSTSDINDVMNQYMYAHKDFKYLGAVPIDFDDIRQLNIKNLNFDDLYNDGKYKLGIIFNTDEHYKAGSHWIALYVDLKKCQIYFSDSCAMVPDDRIRELVGRIAKWCAAKHFNFHEDANGKFMITNKKNNIESINGMDIRFNRKRHQYKDSECGMYSMNFILRLLEGDTFDDYINKQIPDDEINKYREKYFIYK